LLGFCAAICRKISMREGSNLLAYPVRCPALSLNRGPN